MVERLYPKFVSMVGAAGLALGLAYFLGVYLAFLPRWQNWADFFVPAAVPLLALPCVLLLTYLYLRTHLGQWLLERGCVEETIAYCEQRLDHTLQRGRKEALINRITLAQALVVRGDYEAAEEVLASGYAMPDKGAEALDICRWRMEVALRIDNLVRCHRAYEHGADIARPRQTRAYLRACRAELAARESDRGEFEAALDEALWHGPDLARVKLVQIVGLLRFGGSDEEYEDALEVLKEIAEPILSEVPGREAELVALRAEIFEKFGRADRARRVLDAADQARADTRSEYLLRRVRERISAPSSTSP